MSIDYSIEGNIPWNKGKLVGQKVPLKPPEVWAIRVRLQLAEKRRDLALFNLAIDSKRRGCDLLRIRVSDLRIEMKFVFAPRSSKARQEIRSNSKLPNARAKP